MKFRNYISKFVSIYDYIELMGIDWFLFRVKYELLKKLNYFDKLNEIILKKVSSCNNREFFYKQVGLVNQDFIGDSSFVEKADNAREGKIFAFSNEYFDYNKDESINWQMNPISKVKADSSLSWNRLADFGEYGDIKLIWEASRFPQVYYSINAYSTTKDEKYIKEQESNMKKIVDTIKKLSKSTNYLVLIHQVPESGWHNILMQMNKLIENKINTNNYNPTIPLYEYLKNPTSLYEDRTKLVEYYLNNIQEDNVIHVRPYFLFCNNFIENYCVLSNEKNILYWDTNHLNYEGSKILVDKLFLELEKKEH